MSQWNGRMAVALRASRYVVVTALLANPAVVRAQSMLHVDLVCNTKANLALVRFAIDEEETLTFPRLPKALDRGLSGRKAARRTDCALANGTTIRVRGGHEQSRPYGMGGGDPPAFFSLWINQRKVFSRRQWKPGYAESFSDLPIYDGALIAANRITICATADDKPQHCTSEPLDLSKAPFDPVEYGPANRRARVGHISFAAKGAANRRFCKAYLGVIKSGFATIVRGAPSFDSDLRESAEVASVPGTYAYSGMVTLSPGVDRRFMIWESISNYFDGTVFTLAPSDMSMQDILAAYPFGQVESWPTMRARPGVTVISGGQKQLYPDVSPRYVQLLPQRVEGSLYVLAYPSNNAHRPTAVLVKPLAEGGFVSVCNFNRTQLHY